MANKKKQSGEESRKNRSGLISRREFTIGSMAMFGATTLEPGKAVAEKAVENAVAPFAAAEPHVTASGQTIKLIVNQWEYEVQVKPESVLRDVLRDQLGFVSIKDMCNGFGACGSCTVIMDGRPVLSCLTLASECDGATIETAEGVAENSPDLIEAYVLNHCMQCGYCTPGFVVTAKALIDRIPNPTEEDIREALGGNICRCGTYPAHLRAVKEATDRNAKKG
jgi:aerobic-type carbon monoxide dehydrogenase small subunit (CoxS/CutS family)